MCVAFVRLHPAAAAKQVGCGLLQAVPVHHFIRVHNTSSCTILLVSRLTVPVHHHTGCLIPAGARAAEAGLPNLLATHWLRPSCRRWACVLRLTVGPCYAHSRSAVGLICLVSKHRLSTVCKFRLVAQPRSIVHECAPACCCPGRVFPQGASPHELM